MGWSYRVMRRNYPVPAGFDAEPLYEIYEVYFDVEPQSGEKSRFGPTENPSTVSADSPGDLRWVLERMLKALDEPIMDYDDPGGPAVIYVEPTEAEETISLEAVRKELGIDD